VLQLLQIVAVLLVAVAMALALAHALELPGKLRLSKEQYLQTQAIYYPGFTIGGIAEPLALALTLLLTILAPREGPSVWLTGAAVAALAAMHAAYWLWTHPVNNFWIEGFRLKGAAAGFFAFDPLRRRKSAKPPDWTELRDRWEYSHVARAVLGLLSLTLLVTAMTV
jgi:hypothetical protein